MKIYEGYPGHPNDFMKVGLAPKVFPSLKEFWKKADASKFINDKTSEKQKWRNT